MLIVVRSSDATAFAARLDAARNRVERFPIVLDALRRAADALRGRLSFLRVGEVICDEVARTRLAQGLGGSTVAVSPASDDCAMDPTVVVALDAAAITSIVWCACGGSGKQPAPREGSPGPVEIGILRLLGQTIADEIAGAVARDVPAFRAAPVAAGVLEVSSPLLASEAEVFSCRLSLGLPGGPAHVTALLAAGPFAAFRDVPPAGQRPGSGPKAAHEAASVTRLELDRTSVDVEVVLDEIVVPLGGLAALAPGGLLALRAVAGDRVWLESGGVRLARGRIAKRGGRLVVEVESVGGGAPACEP